MPRFNPLPLPKQGETVPEGLLRVRLNVSIRSPYRSKGRHSAGVGYDQAPFRFQSRSPYRSKGRLRSLPTISRHGRFQSAPPYRSKGRRISVLLQLIKILCFNPLPLPKQGETYLRLRHQRFFVVSIRSPYRSKGRPIPLSSALVMIMFQSAPLTEARGDQRTQARQRGTRCFNPLPLPKQGETSWHRVKRLNMAFQSAPLTEARGDSFLLSGSMLSITFQSAPLTEARGDLRENVTSDDGSVVSIRSPYRSKGRPATLAWPHHDLRSCFNPLPLPKQGETLHRRQLYEFHNVSNPLPLPKQGETSIICPIAPISSSVSIRSPYRSKGRLSSSRSSRDFDRFQSAPLTEARGDPTGTMPVIVGYIQFQSAPLTEARGDPGCCNQQSIRRLYRLQRDSFK